MAKYRESVVDLAHYANARDVENRLITLIDGGENLADWYTVEGAMRRAVKTSPVVDLTSRAERAADRWQRTLDKLKRDSRPLGGGSGE